MKNNELHLYCKPISVEEPECRHEVFILVQSSKGKSDEEHILNIVTDAITKELMDDYNVKEASISSGSIEAIENDLDKLHKKAITVRRKELGYQFSEIPQFLGSKIKKLFSK